MNKYVNIYNINFKDFIPKSANDAIKHPSGTVLTSRKNVPVTIPDEIPKNFVRIKNTNKTVQIEIRNCVF